ncbi:alpha/beta fold hydrolase [Alteribacillus sp. YIM 98480]|uniref:alpha/beta fold hydrolase n=1 Tax=Alteribacillus sp. YIM 98480 TaxID=2606599 RepID=UPI00131B5ED0|nr:alpha/beta hydrolase [Alteribacillus sp. YIM 98480]
MNAQLNFKVVGPAEAPPLLLLHELGGSISSWQWMEPILGDRFRHIIVDLPGAGDSPILNEEMSLEEVADSLVQLLDYLEVQRVNVAGSAYGAVTAAYLSSLHSDRVSSVMLIAIGSSITEKVSEYVHNRANQVENEGMEAVVHFSLESSFPLEFHTNHPDIVESYRNIFISNDPDNYAVCSRSIANAGTTLTRRIQSIPSRTAVVGGKQDPSFTPQVIQEVADLLTPPVKPVIIEKAGHFPHIQAPKKLGDLMIRHFLS